MVSISGSESAARVSGMTIFRSDVSRYHQRFLKMGKAWQPDVSVINKNGTLLAVKDYAAKGLLSRLMGWFAIRQEAWIYSQICDIEGIPAFCCTVDSYALAIEYIEGRTSADCTEGDLPVEFFQKVAGIVEKIHERDIVLCDMRNNKNILVDKNLAPYLIDFATSFKKGFILNFPKNILFSIFYQDDLHGVLKLKHRLAPGLLTEAENLAYTKGLPLQKEAIAVRNFVRKYLKKLTVFL